MPHEATHIKPIYDSLNTCALACVFACTHAPALTYGEGQGVRENRVPKWYTVSIYL